MKPVCGFLLIVFLLSGKVSFGQGEDNAALEQTISLEARHETLATVLDKIASQAGVYFSYDPSLIGADQKIDASLTDKSIREILDVLLAYKFTYQVLDNQIVITAPSSSGVQELAGEIRPSPGIITFRGKVIDRDEKEVLPFTSISIQNRYIGTISNMDGDFELKIASEMLSDTAIVSCMGYRPFSLPVSEIREDMVTIFLQPATIQLKEIQVTYISPEDIVRRIVEKIPLNYARNPQIMTSFYREVLRQDQHYIDVAEAVIDIRKASYDNTNTEDKVKLIKGRKSFNVKPFQGVVFKIQGGPYYSTKLDVIKTLDSFLDPAYTEFYKYSLNDIVQLNDRPTYVIHFKPRETVDDPFYQGKMWVDMSSFALVQAEFELSRSGLKFAKESLIQKKPKDFFVRPLHVRYLVNYRRSDGNWHLSNAQTSINFRVRSKKDKVNSLFHSSSQLLITDFKADDRSHFKRNELFGSKDIFTEMVSNYDENFWGDYNIIKPSEDLRKALKNYPLENDSQFNTPEFNKPITLEKLKAAGF